MVTLPVRPWDQLRMRAWSAFLPRRGQQRNKGRGRASALAPAHALCQVEGELPDYYAPGRAAHKMRLEWGGY